MLVAQRMVRIMFSKIEVEFSISLLTQRCAALVRFRGKKRLGFGFEKDLCFGINYLNWLLTKTAGNVPRSR